MLPKRMCVHKDMVMVSVGALCSAFSFFRPLIFPVTQQSQNFQVNKLTFFWKGNINESHSERASFSSKD